MGIPSMQKLMQQAKKMQEDMLRKKEELKQKTVKISSGGGAVTVVFSGAMKLMSIDIDSHIVNSEDIEMLENLVLAAINEGIKAVQDLTDSELGLITNGMNLPGM